MWVVRSGSEEKSEKKLINFRLIWYLIDIICFFASKGFWPFYPTILQAQVNEMGKKVFSLGDDKIRQFCQGKFNFQETCYRPGEFIYNTISSRVPTQIPLLRFCFEPNFFPVYYKGYFVPDTSGIDCPTTTKAPATTAKPAKAQSWDTPARIQSTNNNNAARSVTSIVQQQKTPNDVEVFESTLKPTKAPQNSVGTKAPQNSIETKAPQNSVEDLGEKQAPNINIEIHNIFSFGAENAQNLSKNNTREV